MTQATEFPTVAPATVASAAEPRARGGLRRGLLLLALGIGAMFAGQALALAVVGVAQGAAAPVPAAQLKSGFKKATGQALVVDKLRSSTGSYTAFNLGVQTADRKARYGTFTIYLVTDPDLEAGVARLLANPQTGAVGTPDAAGIHWEKGRTAYGDPYWQAKRRYGPNVVLWWIGEKPVKKIESSYTTLNKALVSVVKKK